MAQLGRRQFLAGAGALAASTLARAQPRTPVVGLLYPNPSTTAQGTAQNYFSGILKKHGWTVGKDVTLEHASCARTR